MILNEFFNLPGSRKKRKRVGRGIGSTIGKTCGRGHKGQKARSGVSIKTEGGQMPIIKRLPKRGFNSLNPVSYSILKVADIDVLVTQNRLDPAKVVNKVVLVNLGLIKNQKVLVKLLGGLDKIKHKLTIELDACSKAARSVIEEAGGVIL